MHHYPGIEINVQGGGSSAGIRAVQNHICHMGMSSRHLTPEEEKNIQTYRIALDGIVLIVHKDNPVANLTRTQVREIFTGRIRNWQDLGGKNRRITVITREEGPGTRASFEEKVMDNEHFAPDALVQDSNGAVREIVAGNPAAIGYISYGLVDERVKPLAIDTIAPSESAIRNGTYPLVREFLFLTCGEPGELTRNFIQFVFSPAGQRALADEGLIRARRRNEAKIGLHRLHAPR